jgi:hypothetical protein
MPFVEWHEQLLDLGLGDDFFQGPAPHPADDLLDGLGSFDAFDDQRQLHRRRRHLHRGFGVRVLGSVNDFRPTHQFGQIRRFPAPPLARHPRDESRARGRVGIVKFLFARIAPVLLGVLGAEKGALMMIEPPGQARIRRVLEIHDGVDVAVEHPVFEDLICLVSQAREEEFRIRVESLLEKAAEVGRRSSAIEAVVVIQDSHPHGKAN